MNFEKFTNLQEWWSFSFIHNDYIIILHRKSLSVFLFYTPNRAATVSKCLIYFLFIVNSYKCINKWLFKEPQRGSVVLIFNKTWIECTKCHYNSDDLVQSGYSSSSKYASVLFVPSLHVFFYFRLGQLAWINKNVFLKYVC